MPFAVADSPRWELYRLLGEPRRLRLLGLTSEDELSIGELAELTREAQPNVSKHLKLLREAGLVAVRRQGTRAFARLSPDLNGDPLLADAIRSGRDLCAEDGSLERVVQVIQARDEDARAFFEQPSDDASPPPVAAWSAYLTALRTLLPKRGLAVDLGTGDGALVELLAPLFDRVIAVDRSEKQLEAAAGRLSSHGYDHVELVQADYDDPPSWRAFVSSVAPTPCLPCGCSTTRRAPSSWCRSWARWCGRAARWWSSTTAPTTTSSCASARPISGLDSSGMSFLISPSQPG